MIHFERFFLQNGLKVIVHKDASTPIAAMNILYDVGSRDEDPERTGFAHLFEHLMFGGSENIPCYDEPLERTGGENNAFTNSDITNYYLTLPSQNIETGFWLESDRMKGLALTEKSLDVQRHVVVEEFRQSYLNQPYGDVFLLLRELAYKVHPYRWDTIGKDISHIQQAQMNDVKAFFKKFYHPANAILVVAGDVDVSRTRKMAEKWFGTIPRSKAHKRNLPAEPKQTAARKLEVKRKVPFDTIYKVYHCCSRKDKEFHTMDLLSDILSNGRSSRLFRELVMNKKLFSELDAYVTGELDKGLFIFSGKLSKEVKMETAEEAILEEIRKICKTPPSGKELEKVQNKIESTKVFSEMSVLNKAMGLAFAELMGDANRINTEIDRYRAVTATMIQNQAKKIFNETNCSTIYYYAEKK